jgi:putative ABC transport system permease protein
MSASERPRSALRRRTLLLVPMARLAVKMMFHDRAKLAGTLLGVVFATVLMLQQLGVFFGLIYKNTQYVDNAEGVDLWIVPPNTEQAQPGPPLSMTLLTQARTTPGVAWAEPLLMGGTGIRRPDGGLQGVTLVGTTFPRLAGGPYAIVAGSPQALRDPDTVIFEDGQRDDLGGVNLGSVRELGGRRVVARGFTWGLLPFAPGYAFANYETARGILRVPSDQTSFVLIGLDEGADEAAVQAELSRRAGTQADVYTTAEYHDRIVNALVAAQLGISFGTSTVFALIVGFVIVALSMFSAVVDNVREFGTLKAIGATTFDLTKLLFVQAVLYALLGTTVGLFLASFMAEGIRSANLVLLLPRWLIFGSYGVMTLLCVVASALAVLRVRNIEPGMVFR